MSLAAPAALVLFDLDGTLLEGDTDQLWCEHLIDEGVLDGAVFSAANAAVSARYACAEIEPAAYCAFYAATLAGRTPAAWSGLRERFITDCIAPRIGPAARELVDRHRAEGANLVLTTATNRFLTEPIAAWLGFGHLIATELEVAADGCFTGANQGVLNMREGKVERLRAWLQGRGEAIALLGEATFYSDSINDLPLLEAVGRAVVVDPDPRLLAEAERRGWPVLRLAARSAAG